MLYIYQSNRVERLFAQLVRVLLSSQASPLQPEQVVVENPGLAHWVKMQLAQSLGIAANIEFPMPSRFFWQVQRSVMPELGTDSIFAKDSLTWMLYQTLPSHLQRPEFASIARYLDAGFSNEEHSGENETPNQLRRRFQLASQIADLYDQYLVYRPDWIEQWSSHSDLTTLDGEPLGPDQQWQPLLWQALLQQGTAQGLPLSHRASMLQDFMQRLRKGQHKNLPSQVVFFGFSALPKHQLETLSLLSQHMDVHLMVPNPCQHYWGDVYDEKRQALARMRGQSILGADAGNDLLASLGRMGQEFQRQLLDLDLGHVNETVDFYGVETEDVSALHQLQQHILDLHQAKHPDEKQVLAADDTSIQVVGCHSPMREVEVLHDHLLDLFQQASDAGTPLNPQDIVVMIPDVAAYAPYIDAVFSQTVANRSASPSASQTIPYSISDRPVQAEHPLLSAFSNLMALPMGRFAISDVLALLETPAVYRRYDLTEIELPQLRDWLHQAGVRWGLDGKQRSEQGLPSWQDNTWLAGFKRLLMGYAMAGPEPVFGTTPVISVEGLATETLGKLMAFVNDLAAFAQATKQTQTVSQWAQWLTAWIQRVFAPDDSEQHLIQTLFDAIDLWVEGAQRVKFNDAIVYNLMADALSQRLQQRSGSQHFMVGKVNFCTLLPMRSIPFKVVAVLGLNDSDYPRHVPPRAFDLMARRRRVGDRSRRDEDRYLFLEAVVSARESLWLSYRSRNQKSNDEQTPSVVLAELLDYLTNGFYCQGDAQLNHEQQGKHLLARIFTQHPLQPFNRQYFDGRSPLFSYHADWYQVHKPELNASLQTRPKNEFENTPVQIGPSKHLNAMLELDDLIRFWQNPSRFYLNKVLDIHLGTDLTLTDEDEPFELDGLQQFQLKQTWLNTSSSQQDLHWLAAGQLAFGEIGERQLQSTLSSVADLKSTALSLMGERNKPMEVRVQFELESSGQEQTVTQVLQGWLKQLYGRRQVLVFPSRLKGHHVLNGLIQHCALNAMGNSWPSYVLAQDQGVEFMPLSTSEAKAKLQQLVDHCQYGLKQPFAFLPNTAWQLHSPAFKTNHEKEAQKTFFGVSTPYIDIAGEREETHVQRCLGWLDDIPVDTINMAQALFEDLIAAQTLKLTDLQTLAAAGDSLQKTHAPKNGGSRD